MKWEYKVSAWPCWLRESAKTVAGAWKPASSCRQCSSDATLVSFVPLSQLDSACVYFKRQHGTNIDPIRRTLPGIQPQERTDGGAPSLLPAARAPPRPRRPTLLPSARLVRHLLTTTPGPQRPAARPRGHPHPDLSGGEHPVGTQNPRKFV